jgi:hypothetical protein
LPFGGHPVIAVCEIEKEGGPAFFESFLPVSTMLKGVFEQVFRGCQREREKLGLYNDPQVCVGEWLKVMDSN